MDSFISFLEEEIKGYSKSDELPHYDSTETYQFISFRLHDAVPKNQIYKWMDELSLSWKPEKKTKEYIIIEKKMLNFEDDGYGECYLKNPLIYKLVQETLEIFNCKRYELIEWVIMPSHVHVLIKASPDFSLPKIVQSWKSYTANKANQILGRKGKFWMEGYFDCYIRSAEHLSSAINYIKSNELMNK